MPETNPKLEAIQEMKKDIHPKYDYVVFRDEGADFDILTRTTMTSADTVKWKDGNTYPLIRVELSSASHPFYTGKQKIVDTAGRVERFEKRYGRRKGNDAEGEKKNEKADQA